MGCSASTPLSLSLLAENPQPINSKASSTSTSTSIAPPPNSTSNSSSFASSHTSNSRALSFSAPLLVHHPPLRKGDSHHLVSLTSTTYGNGSLLRFDHHEPQNQINSSSSSPDSVINTWELMDGLNDSQAGNSHSSNSNSFIFDHPLASATGCSYSNCNGSVKKSSSSSRKPLWKHLSEESLLSKMDPNVGLTYTRALSCRCIYASSISNACNLLRLPGGEDKIVIYFTSLRGIRKTYEDCCAVQMIFRGFRVAVDERDVSMDSKYKKELENAVGVGVALPQVFVRGKHVGGAEQVKQLNELGQLGNLLRGFPTAVAGGGFVCEGCRDARFGPCPTCRGSRKLFDGDQREFRRCPHCNHNGLIRCPLCRPLSNQ